MAERSPQADVPYISVLKVPSHGVTIYGDIPGDPREILGTEEGARTNAPICQ